MGSLRLSTVGSIAVLVCLSILLLSPTEVDGWGKCDYRKGVCSTAATSSTCDEPCKALDSKYHGGECLNVGGGQGICWCCHDYDAKRGAEKDSM
ncbi:Low-molecular-weight cysteine-rich family [Arabidopsis suecica]|uniref:Low-molecular-weight cysteine-rich family n=2 Tax=Arabidopsis suecica TaxID=45249 RepID=A0A8T1YKM1_ARASU|nr:Low-molecular-weight cysteine-rich family [Arabidopsis suecica]